MHGVDGAYPLMAVILSVLYLRETFTPALDGKPLASYLG
jgi:hypothetical protein